MKNKKLLVIFYYHFIYRYLGELNVDVDFVERKNWNL